MRSFVLAFATVLSLSVRAQQSQPVPSSLHRHFGFFIRPDLGFGYMTATEPTGSAAFGDLTVSGFSGVAGLGIGGAISENVILGVHFFDAVAANPKVSLSSGQSGTASNVQLTMWGIGPELTYYFMPANVYISATAGVSGVSITQTSNGRTSDTSAGFGSRVTLGKEWWVSDHWGLGLAGHVSFSTNNDPASNGQGNTLTTWVLGAAFSATYN
jgi:hypothetical protein